jgi:hypothetical protein
MFSLKQSLQALHTEQFVDTLQSELSQVEGNLFPLERACAHGGLPDPKSVHVCEIGQVTHEETLIVVPLVLSFNELRGAGCGGESVEYYHLADCRLNINPATGCAWINIVESEALDEF